MNMLMTTLGDSCNIIACRAEISYYILQESAYNTSSFYQCLGCSQASYPNFPSDWSNRWYTQDFYIYSGPGLDCEGNPFVGNLMYCEQSCLIDTTCVGFSREKNVADTDSSGECYLKTTLQTNQVHNDSTWHTVAFNSTS